MSLNQIKADNTSVSGCTLKCIIRCGLYCEMFLFVYIFFLFDTVTLSMFSTLWKVSKDMAKLTDLKLTYKQRSR